MPKEIRIVVGGLAVGGAERHLSYVLPQLAQQGFDIRIITLTDDNPLAPIFNEAGVAINQPKLLPLWIKKMSVLKKLWRLMDACLRLYKDYRCDPHIITHFFLPESYIIGTLISFVARVKGPRVMSRRSLNVYQQKYLGLAFVEKQLHKSMDFILGNSKRVVQQLNKQEHVPLSKLGLIYNGIDIDAFDDTHMRDLVRHKMAISNDTVVLVITANLIPYKGHKDLLKALIDIRDQIKAPWVLLVIGQDRGVGQSLKDSAEEGKISSNVKWLGQRDDIPDLLQAADIGLLVSHEEGFSNAIIESMAAKLPMIVTDVGGNAEAVLHQTTGLVVPTHDYKALGQAILTLIYDEQKRHEYGEAGRQRAQQHFTLSQCAQRYAVFYNALLRGEKPPLDPTTQEIIIST